MNEIEKIEKLQKEKQFLTDRFGYDKLDQLFTALDKLCEENNIAIYELEDIIHLHRVADALPEH